MKKEAAMTGVLYYLLEEEKELTGAERDQTPLSGTDPWRLSARSFSAGARRMIQGRKFSPPAVGSIVESRAQNQGPAFRHAQITVQHQMMLVGCAAGRRKARSRNS